MLRPSLLPGPSVLVIASLPLSVWAGPQDEPHLTITPWIEAERARIAEILATPTDFTKPRPVR